MRGLSGAVTALILVVASVVIALIVVGFAFNLFGSFGSEGAVSPVGAAYISSKAPPNSVFTNAGKLYLNVTINNRGPNVTITSATINGQTVYSNSQNVQNSQIKVFIVDTNTPSSPSVTIPSGQHRLVIAFNGIDPNTIGTGPINIQLNLNNGQTIYITAVVIG